MDTKKAIRTALLAKRAAISDKERPALDGALCRQIEAHPFFRDADAVLLYFPMRGEPDLTPLLSLLDAREIPVYLPRCEGDKMRFLLYTGKAALEKDRFGILAPAGCAPESCPTEHTLCVLPGLAADQSGTRLGYGGGFYDRFLPHFKGKLLFPLYHQMVCDTLPREECDFLIPKSSIITEKGVLENAQMDTRTPQL